MTAINCFSSATALVRAIRQREISAVEVLDLFLAQYDKHHAAVNAICTLDADGARQAAAAADARLARGDSVGPLHGLPVSFKDSHGTAGLRTVCGFEPLRNFVPQQDGFAVAGIRAAGGIVFAKTNVPPLLGAFHTENPVFGRTNNPWNLDCSPGASSGGSGAALAAGMTPLDIGSDMLGSIRLPSHFCGLAGLKPTQYRVSGIGHYPPLEGGFSAGNVLATRGPLARCVDDLLLVLPALAGIDPADAEAVPLPLDAAPALPLASCRIAWTDDFGGLPVTAATRKALHDTVNALQSAGCRVERAAPAGVNFEQLWLAAGEIFNGTISQGMSADYRAQWLATLESTRDAGPLEAGCYRGVLQDYNSWFSAMAVRLQWILQLRRFLSDYDAWLVPTSCAPAFRHDEVDQPRNIDGRSVPYLSAVASHVAPFNLSGSPAVTIPAALSPEGLPICLQLVGRPWQDMALLKLARQVEAVAGAVLRAPGY